MHCQRSLNRTFLFLFSIYLLSACVGVNTHSIRAPKANFEKYKSFNWLEGSELNYQGPSARFDSSRMLMIKRFIQDELKSRGLKYASDSMDMLIGFHVIVEEEQITIEGQDRMNPYRTEVSYWEGYENEQRDVYRFLKGSLVIDIVDAEKSQVVWQSTTQRYAQMGSEIKTKKIQKGVIKALRDFPPMSD